jgi:hypothetical protein
MSNNKRKAAEANSDSTKKRQRELNESQCAVDTALENVELFCRKDALLEAIQQRYLELRARPPPKTFNPEKLSAYAMRCLGCTLAQSYDVDEIKRRQEELVRDIAAREGSAVAEESAEYGHGQDDHGEDEHGENERSQHDVRLAGGEWKKKNI